MYAKFKDTPIIQLEIARQYLLGDLSVEEISKQFKCTATTVVTYASRHKDLVLMYVSWLRRQGGAKTVGKMVEDNTKKITNKQRAFNITKRGIEQNQDRELTINNIMSELNITKRLTAQQYYNNAKSELFETTS